MKCWHDNWDAIGTIFKFSKDTRTTFYTTNAIESLKFLLPAFKQAAQRIPKPPGLDEIPLPGNF